MELGKMVRVFPRWYEGRSRWQKLRNIGESPATRLSVLMPFAGYLILLNNKIVDYADIDQRFHIFVSHTPWRIYAFYYGSFFVGIAAAVYSVMVPASIKSAINGADYYNKYVGFYRAQATFKALKSHVAKKIESSNSAQKQVIKAMNTESILSHAAKDEAEFDSDLAALVSVFWALDATSRLRVRIVVRILFDLGVFILAVPTIATLFGVSISIFR
ncbi:hypothetical protein EN742_29900 [Mesorhizobium sp. M4A.F.Ca.ET.020.02.1.1]|uniref:hypothetical protein n=1 Tax=unclassified Mesorhizobium TaxID=325217 RepID=UPI000FD4F6CB|nr:MULTISPECIES: hypothetical protein [unclassified Mesorhizobium]RVD33411.1 hypothetical protein EN742_29900 [Mesorhizobium sp. M4A.F.Ca.ET.020.02.1.1]RWC10908.1 MAG: hypothetical protein EOS53_28250 [Mesorhizobium sp.]TIX57092.1 MAG: hypothetical protein E5V33_22275 [Mesorhizobium sp.]